MTEVERALQSSGLGDRDRLPCGTVVVQVDGTVIDVNSVLAAMVGRQAHEIRGHHIDDLLSGGGRMMYHSYLLPLLRLHGRVEEFSLALKPLGRDPIDVLFYASARGSDDPGLIDIVVLPMRDRRRLEDELLRVKRAAELAPGMLFQLTLSNAGRGAFGYLSESVHRLYGLSVEQARGSARRLLHRVHPGDRRALLNGLVCAGRRLERWGAAYRVRADDGSVTWHEVHATPRSERDGLVQWHGYAADITERRAGEQALLEKESNERASRAKSQFLARISHELRTPLNGILGFAHLLAADPSSALNADQRRKLDIIESEGRSLLKLINEVLDITRIETGRLAIQLRPVLMHPLLEQALQMIAPVAQASSVSLSPLQCPPELWVQGDDRRLIQVLVNLLSNAIKYNRPGGRVELRAASDGHEACVVIEDTGNGMSGAQVEDLFQPFNRLGAERTATQGIGLGLVIARGLVALMAGRIEVSSVPGVGSSFRVLLPLSETRHPEAAAANSVAVGDLDPAAPAPDAALPSGAKSVLYAEDNAVNTLLMEAVLRQRPGVVFRSTADGAGAVAEALRDPPDLLLLDMNLPDMDGIALLNALREQPTLRHVPAVVVSAAAMPEDIARAHAAGFSAYWTKPLDINRVLGQLDALLKLDQNADA